MVKIKVCFGELFNSTWQYKSFKTETDAVIWCKRNHQKIWYINDYRTFGQPVSGFDVLSAIKGYEN